jgi:CheY-like chemotaxis protein
VACHRTGSGWQNGLAARNTAGDARVDEQGRPEWTGQRYLIRGWIAALHEQGGRIKCLPDMRVRTIHRILPGPMPQELIGVSADRETGISGWAAGASYPPTRHAQEALPYVFDAYFTTKPVGLGSGLGLASVRDIVSGAGGQITVHSRPGLGATFRLWLPVVTDIPAASRPQAGGRTQVVVLDRDPDVTRVVSRILSASGMDLHLSSSAAEALALAEQLPAFDTPADRCLPICPRGAAPRAADRNRASADRESLHVGRRRAGLAVWAPVHIQAVCSYRTALLREAGIERDRSSRTTPVGAPMRGRTSGPALAISAVPGASKKRT